MALRATLTAPPLPSDTYLLAVDGIIQATQLGFGWRDALDLLWSGDYNSGTPRLIHVAHAEGVTAEVTHAALTELAERAFVEREVPDHLAPLFRAAGISAVLLSPIGPAPALGRRAALAAH